MPDSLVFDPYLETDQPLSLGLTQARLCSPKSKCESAAIFFCAVNGYSDLAKTRIVEIDFPELSISRSQLSIMTLQRGEVAYSLPTIPGFLDFYQELGILDKKEQVVELMYEPDLKNLKKIGFPYSNLLYLAFKQKHELQVYDSIITTYPCPYSNHIIESLSGVPIQKSDASLSNNKAELRRNMGKYGYVMPEGREIHDRLDLKKSMEEFKDTDRLWLKTASGAGGQMVLPIDSPFTLEKLEMGVNHLKSITYETFKFNEFNAEAVNNFWPEHSQYPAPGNLLIEKNINYKIIGCNILLISDDGRYNVPFYSQQIVDSNGRFLGSSPLHLDKFTLAKLNDTMGNVAQYCYQELNFRGIAGVDFMLVEDGNNYKVIVSELNSRPPANSLAYMLAQKVHSSSWIGINLRSPEPLETISDFKRIFHGYIGADPTRGIVIPQTFKSLYSLKSKQKELHTTSHIVRALICGNDLEHCRFILKDLSHRGIHPM